MTSEEIRETIERLKAMPRDNILNNWGVVTGFMNVPMDGSFSTFELREKLIDLLEMADPETHVELPVDADGVPIRIGDEMDFSEGVRGLTVLGIGTSDAHDGDMGVFVLDDDGYTWFNARFLHHHRPTVKEVLRMFLAESEDAMRKGYDEVPDPIYVRYADKLREILEVNDG